MKIIIHSLLIATMGVSVVACNNGKSAGSSEGKPMEEMQTTSDEHTAQSSLDWSGSYSGILPCADCEGIQTTLRLNNDLGYELIEEYLGNKGKGESHIQRGKFEWKGDLIQLKGLDNRSQWIRVQENHLVQLDSEAQPVTGALADMYVLKKNGNPQVENIRWQLIELNGKAVSGKPDTHYVIFHSDEGKLEAKANCNAMQFNYVIQDEYRLRISPGMSTLMACPDNTEDELKKALEMVDNITFSDTELSLNKGRMAPLARFKKVN